MKVTNSWKMWLMGAGVSAGLLVVGIDRDGSMKVASSAWAGPAAPHPGARWVALHPGDGPLAERVLAAVKEAEARGEVAIAYLGASWCGPCRALKKYRNDPRMAAAFEGTTVLELDIDQWKSADMSALGFRSDTVPVFFALGPDGKSTGASIDGGAWGEDIPENMAPPLAKFVASLRK